ncbi:glycoside hydrolase family 2 TIM barrel-domain containing protein [Phocaeicola plebeius]|uniref:glycoside hydrolase family 2 protein n=1 Tax=Phocaeicola plebeius TaxID=310297 RepID=UPI0021ABC39A|nr:sugar-binding domain-containing protein [Phocaeicola plebeius]MCR8882848.1 beta-galactosidase [Phocaeicola plebeius]MDM8286535.1 glycoside hydrolase family 2 TIM barrel-domain containing protein [Phocaeicola plebeius]
MKKLWMVLALWGALAVQLHAQWKPVEGRISTQWSEQVNPDNVLPEYPRPIMERTEWKNLNGLWDYAIIEKGKHTPSVFDGKILVPFAVESSLSGVGKTVGAEKELVYRRSFDVPSSWKGKRVLLHFGAVDWKTDVWVNDVKVGSHTGGFTPFSFDITEALQGKNNTLMVKVWDPTDKGYQPRGKQVSRPEGIWYTPVTGIWQTVWLEPVSESYIQDLRITPDIDNSLLSLKALVKDATSKDLVEVKVFDGQQLVAQGKSINGECVQVAMPENAKLWSPESPFLYTLKVSLKQGGKLVDEVSSYAAMRKYSSKRDANGIVRLELNNKPLFQFGPLDQGWWPDGLYTAPTDEALLYDIQKTKDFGFNMIRKHIKVEPARWYTYCDKLGIIVWQDMPSGDRNPEWQNRKYFEGTEMKRSAESEACYRKEWKEIMDALYSYPCIGTWIPFNEAWGQFKTPEIVEWTKQYDPTRLVNPASGGNHYTCGDMLDLHNYPAPELYLYDAQRATVLGEYGGIGWVVQGHIWEPDRNWGYIQFNSSKEVTDEYVKYAEKLYDLIPRGFSAAVYTQTTDVEVEVNGLMTYDRKVIKLDEKRVREINRKLCESLNK